MRQIRRSHFLFSLIIFCGSVVFVDAAITNTLTQQHFLLDPTQTNVSDAIVFRDLNNQIIPRSLIATQITSRISKYCSIILPSIEVRQVEATNFLQTLVDIPFLSPPQNSIGLGISVNESTNIPPLAEWVQILPVTNNIINSGVLTNIAYIELIDRLAQFLQLKTGVLQSGDLIFGTTGNWATNYVPNYLLELSIRYQE